MLDFCTDFCHEEIGSSLLFDFVFYEYYLHIIFNSFSILIYLESRSTCDNNKHILLSQKNL